MCRGVRTFRGNEYIQWYTVYDLSVSGHTPLSTPKMLRFSPLTTNSSSRIVLVPGSKPSVDEAEGLDTDYLPELEPRGDDGEGSDADSLPELERCGDEGEGLDTGAHTAVAHGVRS